MNLENLNLVELNAQEVQETEGGNWLTDFVSTSVYNVVDIAATSLFISIPTMAGVRDGVIDGAKGARN